MQKYNRLSNYLYHKLLDTRKTAYYAVAYHYANKLKGRPNNKIALKELLSNLAVHCLVDTKELEDITHRMLNLLENKEQRIVIDKFENLLGMGVYISDDEITVINNNISTFKDVLKIVKSIDDEG